MTQGFTRSRTSRPQSPWPLICLLAALAAPVVVFVAVVGTKTGALNIGTTYDLLTWQIGFWLAGVGVVAALIAIVLGLRAPRQAGVLALATVIVSAATVGLFWRATLERSAPAFGGDVSTNTSDSPGFSPAVMAARQASGAGSLTVNTTSEGCTVQAVNSQVAPGVAGYAIQNAGFTLARVGVGGADGSHRTTWFDRTYDAVVRVRPGRTDIRVSARDTARDNGEACRLAIKIASGLQ